MKARGWLRWLAVPAAALAVAGCVQVETVLKVRPDGSGTIEQTVWMDQQQARQVEAALEGMSAWLGGAMTDNLDDAAKARWENWRQRAKQGEPFNEQTARQAAEQYGAGVVFVSGRDVARGSAVGYAAVYAFTDVQQLTLPVSAQPASMENGAAPDAKQVTFEFTQGSTSVLTVRMPQ